MTRVAPHVGHAPSLGALLDDALVQHKSRVALIEADRKREAGRWTYLDADRTVRRVSRRLQDVGFGADDRLAVLMTNQPRWLLSAAAVFRRGGVLVPLDYKLEPHEQQALLAHCRPRVLVVEWPIWRKLDAVAATHVWVSEAPPDADLRGAERWEDLPDGAGDRVDRVRTDLAAIVYSSGTGGRAKGCMLSHGAYLSQLEALLTRFPIEPGDRYFSILPTNHAIDFMVGFVGPWVCGATVVHQRTLRPEMLRFTMQRYEVTHMAVVPLLLAAFERAVRERLEELPAWQRQAIDALVAVNGALTDRRPNHALSSRLLAPLHQGFGGKLRLMFCGGAFTERSQAEFFARIGIPVVIGYGLTEACTVVTVNGLSPPRADSVGDVVPGVEVHIADPDHYGVGEVCVRGPTVMSGYLDDPELTAETIRDGWLHTGDLGWFDASRHLHLCGRIKDVVVTPGGKNVYPEDVEFAFAGLPVEELAVLTANALWPERTMIGERLLLVVRADAGVETLLSAVAERNRHLPDYKRVSGIVGWDQPFPRTASMKLKRRELATTVGATRTRDTVVGL